MAHPLFQLQPLQDSEHILHIRNQFRSKKQCFIAVPWIARVVLCSNAWAGRTVRAVLDSDTGRIAFSLQGDALDECRQRK